MSYSCKINIFAWDNKLAILIETNSKIFHHEKLENINAIDLELPLKIKVILYLQSKKLFAYKCALGAT